MVGNSILKTTISDHYKNLYDLKMNNNLDREVESVFQIKLRNHLDDPLTASKLDFNLNHVLNKFIEKQNQNKMNLIL